MLTPFNLHFYTKGIYDIPNISTYVDFTKTSRINEIGGLTHP